MLVAGRIIKAIVVLVLVLSGGLLVLSGSGVNLDQLMQGRFGADAVVASGALLDASLRYMRLAGHELAVGVLMLAVALLVAFYRT